MDDRLELPLDEVTRPAWQRRDLIILVLHQDCARCEAAARAFDPLPAPLRDPELSVAVVRGEDGAGLREAAGVEGDQAVALVADRFLELFAVLPVHDATPKALAEALGGWAEAVGQQCGECSRM